MEPSNRSLRVALLIAGIVLADVALSVGNPSRLFGSIESDIHFIDVCLALVTSQIAALSIWVAAGPAISPRRASLSLLVDALLSYWFLATVHSDRRAVLFLSLFLFTLATAVGLLFALGRAWGLRIAPREAASAVADQVTATRMQFSLLSLLVVTAILGSLAALLKFLFAALDVKPSFRDVVVMLIICPSFTILGVLTAWLAWGNRWAALRWSLVAVGFAVSVWGVASTDVRFAEEFVMPFSLHLCLLWVYLWLFRRCGYEAVWLRRRAVTAG